MILSNDDIKEMLSIIRENRGFLDYFVTECKNKYFDRNSVFVRFDNRRLNIKDSEYSLVLYPMIGYDNNFFHYYEILSALADIGVGPEVYQPMLMSNPGKCIDYQFTKGMKYMIIPAEQIKGITLADMNELGGKFREKVHSLKFLDTLIKQISRMHNHGIVHGDLRDVNIIVAAKDIVYFINPIFTKDFNMYKLTNEDKDFDLNENIREYYTSVVGGLELLNSYGYLLPRNQSQSQTQYPTFSQ